MIDELVYDDMQIIPNYKSKNDVQLIKISTSQFILAVVYRNTEQNYIDTYLLEVSNSANNYINTLEVSNNKFTTLTTKKQKISQCKQESYVINNFLSFYRGQVVLVCQKLDLQKFEVHIVDISLNTENAVHKYKFEKEINEKTYFFDFQLVSNYQDKIVVLALQNEFAVIFSFNFQLELTCTQSYNYRTDFQRIQDLFNIVIWGDSVFLSYKTRYFYSLVEIDAENCEFTQEQKTQISYEYPHVALAIRTGPKVTVFNFVLKYYIPIFDYKDSAYIKYSTGNIFQYEECPDNCSGSCINESECLYCSNTSNNLFVCNECDENFYLQGNQCIECQVGECECDIYSNDMINLSCQTCDADTKTCLTCDTSKNRVLSSGECICDSFFEEQEVNGKLECVNTDSFFNEETLSGIANAAGTAVASGFLGSGMIFMNPGILLSFLDQLQMIEYIIYTQIQFPSLIYSYFEVFSMFNLEFSFIPGLVPINKNYMPAPLGFEKNDMDSFIFRNIAQYFVFSVALLASYFIGYFINKVISKQIELGALFYFIRFTIFLDYGEIGDQTYKYAAMGVILMATAFN
ncbi:Insulin-like growth factor binding protein, N-terminal [Pseudocohnilembus persalinus]|uniref:Insulin-like growth factor binding protein, N-terminal n=1 Tax=Pseudocohnilembus persalinus TaxID=266149 RepID=A0A0V0QW67_PSEPJ|nr:Insulin-like growth factor binding protein, N-terminal [Pseudocohnilembus persalinus]|eukprot:KRX06466.1 Insulin-like growth factor binding protein, N-terminal [Pseudocohnilembus persalinus]